TATAHYGQLQNRMAEKIGKECVVSMQRKVSGEQATRLAIDVHVDAEDLAAVEGERGSAAGAVHGDGDAQRTRPAPGRHLLADPLLRLLTAIMFGPVADLLGELGGGRFDDEIRRAIGRPKRRQRGGQHESERGAYSHANASRKDRSSRKGRARGNGVPLRRVRSNSTRKS